MLGAAAWLDRRMFFLSLFQVPGFSHLNKLPDVMFPDFSRKLILHQQTKKALDEKSRVDQGPTTDPRPLLVGRSNAA